MRLKLLINQEHFMNANVPYGSKLLVEDKRKLKKVMLFVSGILIMLLLFQNLMVNFNLII